MKVFARMHSKYKLFLYILPLILLYPLSGNAQSALPQDWHLLDLEEDGVFGISAEKAYREVLDHKQPDTVIVAVIDTGVDILHEDLQVVVWHNTREKGGDEDRNGYRGDIHGWNFLGGEDGALLNTVNYEHIRQYYQLREQFKGKRIEEVPRKKHREYRVWTQAQKKFESDSLALDNHRKRMVNFLLEHDQTMQKVVGKETYTYADIKDLELSAEDKSRTGYIRGYLSTAGDKTNKQVITEQKDRLNSMVEEQFSYASYASIARRKEITGDTYKDLGDRYYGNPEIGDTGGHGTHVAGIIGAVRDNTIGIRGIAHAVKIMPIRAIPAGGGDEFDKDVALAIRYAVDNGAQVINMSFAKDLSPRQKWVEKAIRYAARKDVLIVNGAGNDRRSIDTVPKYPTSKYLKKNKRFPNMITVGGSGPYRDKLVDPRSNYGKNMVDVFAPGVDIYSTFKEDYRTMSGTSMATPVVSGIAALLRSYYPDLSARQVKHIIEASVIKPGVLVGKPEKPGSQKEEERVHMSQLCKTGGIVNAYKAVLMAEKYTMINRK